ncbi:hypothetical protein FRC06_006552, partial [Ceratobasidium sp. 370]
RYLQVGLKRANISAEDLETLTERSGALFIYAATVVRYIGAYNFSRSANRLEQILHANTSSNGSDKELNALYSLILSEAFDDPNLDEQEKDEMRLVLYTVICAQEPLSARIMAGILGLKGDEFVHAALNPLRSVLDIQKLDEGITTLHKSFSDYMFDQARSRRFYCDAEKHHATLVGRSFSIIRIPNPPFNICNLESSYVLDKEVAGLDEKIERHISGELFYACRYWGTHLELAGGSWTSLDELHCFLSERLLLWMEVMNLKQCLDTNGVNTLIQLNKLVEHRGYDAKTRELVGDALEFVDAFATSPASRSTPHIYVSALTFWGEGRPVSKRYSNTFQTPIQPMGQAGPSHNQALLPIYALGSCVRCVAFSPDGAHIAAGSDDTTIRICNLRTGETVGVPLEGHTGPACSIAYSPKGTDIVASSTDGTIRTRDARTGQAEGFLFEGHTGAVCSVAYSPSGNYLVSGSADGTIRYWFADQGRACGQPRGGRTGAIYSVARSPDNKWLVSGSSDGTIRTWRTSSGEMTAGLFQGHNGAIYSVAYSPDSAHIISGSEDRSIRIWDSDTGEAIGKPLVGHTAAVSSVVYTPDGARIVSGSADNTIRIWDASSGEIAVGPLMGHHGPVHSVACSPDSAVIASGSADNTICIWDAKTGRMMRDPLKWHTRASHSIVCSSEAASSPSFEDYDVQCSWDADTGNLQFNPSLQNTVSDAIVVTDPPGPDRARTCYVQDQVIIPASTQTISHDPLDHRREAASCPSHSGRPTPTAVESTHFTWVLDSEGWVITNASQRLFWVPQEVRDHIWHPQANGSISRENALWLDPNGIMAGEEWKRRYIALEERRNGDPIPCGGRGQGEPGDPGHPPGSLSTPENANVDTMEIASGKGQEMNFLIICAVVLVLPSIICAYMFG